MALNKIWIVIGIVLMSVAIGIIVDIENNCLDCGGNGPLHRTCAGMGGKYCASPCPGYEIEDIRDVPQEEYCCLFTAPCSLSQTLAKQIAVNVTYGLGNPILSKSEVDDIILEVTPQGGGDYIIHVCDLNEECRCRIQEGYWVEVRSNGSARIIDETLCIFG